MRWRFSKLNWLYGLGELVIVIAGVLIALAVDQWYSDRMDRQEEMAILERLIIDLSLDADEWARQLNGLDQKEASLLRLQAEFRIEAQSVEDPMSLLQDIVVGANWGWNQAEARRITLNELLATGKFTLIEDSGLRQMIAEYYEMDTGIHQRIDERETEYPGISYQLVGRANEGTISGDRNIVELSLSESEARLVATRILDSSLGPHVQAELNFARFVRSMSTRLEAAARELVEALDSYLEGLG